MNRKNIYTDPGGRRNSPRTIFKNTVEVVLQGRLFKEISENVSETGIFLKSKHPEKYTIFEDLTLSFQLADSRPAKYYGTVVRKTDDGIGVLFSGINHPSAYRFSPNIDTLFRSNHSA